MARPTDEDKYLEAFGNRFTKLREEAGLTQEQLAEKVGVSRETISHIETGRSWVRLSMLHKLAKGMRIPTSKLLDGLKQ